MKDYIIIKAESDKYFFKDIKKDYNVYDMYNLKLEKYRLFNVLPPVTCSVLGSWKSKIKNTKVAIIFDTMYEEKVSSYIKKKNPNCKTILYFWNIINDEKRLNILKDPNIDEFWTFDKEEAKKYNMKYNSQFYTDKITLKDKSITNDIFFLGRDKNRKKYIDGLKDIFDKNNIKSNIIFLTNEYKFIPYETYLDYLSESKAVLDVNVEGQSGLSLRCMESLFFHKKLITNNKNIKKYDFYNKNNIFILEEDDYSKLNSFINSKYVDIDKKIIKKYDIESWISVFFN